jgi:branched-chain amino acid transport system permease protein
MNFSKLKWKHVMAFSAAAIILAGVPVFIRSPYYLHLAILLFVYIALASNWNLLAGYTGQLNLGHAAFFGIGAYVSALSYLAGVQPLIGMILGGVTSSIFAVIASPTFRLRGVYFAIGTLALSEAMRSIITNVNALGGASGLRLRDIYGYTKTQYYYIALIVLAISLITIFGLIRSKTGMAFKGICGSQEAAESLGINPLIYKIWSFAVSAFWTGTFGGFYAIYILFIEPNNAFNIFWTFNPVFAVIIGGMGTFLGPIVGSVIFVFISELTIEFGEMSSLFMGILLILVIILVPKGIVGFFRERKKT